MKAPAPACLQRKQQQDNIETLTSAVQSHPSPVDATQHAWLYHHIRCQLMHHSRFTKGSAAGQQRHIRAVAIPSHPPPDEATFTLRKGSSSRTTDRLWQWPYHHVHHQLMPHSLYTGSDIRTTQRGWQWPYHHNVFTLHKGSGSRSTEKRRQQSYHHIHFSFCDKQTSTVSSILML